MSKSLELFDAWGAVGKGDTLAREHWPMTSQIIERMELQPGMRCLDVGCGNGYAVRAMSTRVAPDGHATGVDMSANMLSCAGKHPDNPSNADFQVSMAESLPFEENALDRLLSVEAIYYMPEPLTALKEWRRVLKPGGSVWVMVDYYRENPFCQCWGDLLGIPMKFYAQAEYEALLREAGFRDVISDRLFNTAPLTDAEKAEFKPGWGFDSLEDVIDFRTRKGSLLLSGKK